jgi:N-acetylgalactosamine-6-sulfatase
MNDDRSTRRRPNIVFVFADDWGWGDLGCYGHPFLKTPNLDALADAGTLFTQFYVCSGVCSPSRAAAMTGQFPARHRIHGHYADHDLNERRGMSNWLDPASPTYTRLLREAGYATGHFGKWHLGNGEGAPEPFAYGIDECRVNAGNGPPLGFEVNYHTEDDLGSRSRSSRVIVDEAIAFVERNASRPFLVNVWLNDTHATLDPDPQQLERFRHMMPGIVSCRHVGANAIYAAAVADSDAHIGRLMARLGELCLADDTIVIFSADNGPEDIVIRNASHSGVGSPGPFRGRKRSLYEGGIRVPFILRWPRGGTRAGFVDDETPLCAADLLPSFCRLAGADVPARLALDGEDMSDVFRGSTRGRTTPLMWEWRFRVHGHVINRSPMLAIRRDEWKLLMNPSRDRVELYEVGKDPSELDNVADRHADVVERLAREVLEWRATLPPGPVESSAGSNEYPWPGRKAHQ